MPQADATAAQLRARGHEPYLFPLARIEPRAAALPPPESVDAIVLTSANATPALAPYAHLPVYTVGAATAAAARRVGASRVAAAEGDWRSLAGLLAGPEGPKRGSRLLHLAGAKVRGDLPALARAAGFGFMRRVVYAAMPVQWLDSMVLDRLARSGLDAALFFSPAHAATWCRLVARAGIEDRLGGLMAVALSPAVAHPLRRLAWRRMRIAPAPEVARMLDCLDAPG